jgi:hypothetical protein
MMAKPLEQNGPARQVPERLRNALELALTFMHADSQRRLPWILRDIIYDAFGRKRTKNRYRCRTWVSILAARRVYPFAASAVPGGVEIIDRWLDLATDLVEQRISRDAGPVKEYVLPGFTNVIEPYYEDPDIVTRITFNVNCAFRAADIAAAEAIGSEGLEQVDSYVVRNVDGVVTSDYYMRDEQLVWTGASDAAACAAVAEAWDMEKGRWDPARQERFWQWWLTDAVPRAWQLGHRRIERRPAEGRMRNGSAPTQRDE